MKCLFIPFFFSSLYSYIQTTLLDQSILLLYSLEQTEHDNDLLFSSTNSINMIFSRTTSVNCHDGASIVTKADYQSRCMNVYLSSTRLNSFLYRIHQYGIFIALFYHSIHIACLSYLSI